MTVLFTFYISAPAQADSSYPKFANPDLTSNDNFVTIHSGSFQMGSPTSEAGRDRDEILHEVTISHDFEIQTTTVTQSQYFSVTGKNPSYFSNQYYCEDDYTEINGTKLCPNKPVDQVSWNDIQAFLTKLNSTDAEYSYRLPTEAEWEYTARAGTQTAFWFGDDSNKLGDYVWFGHNSDANTHTVGTKPANAWGLYDAQGNIMQWVSDWYGDYQATPQVDPVGAPTGTNHVIRGGSWFPSGAHYLRAAYRFYSNPDLHSGDIGFRLVRTHK